MNSPSNKPIWVNAYTVELVSRGFWILPDTYAVMFEGDRLRIVSGRETADNVCGMLNGAYNLGRIAGIQEEKGR